MQIVVAFKAVPDDQDILIRPDRTLDFSKARTVVSTYDLNALEAARQLKESNPGSTLVALSIGDLNIDDSKLKKNVLARGVDALYMGVDKVFSGLDAYNTGIAIKALLDKVGSYDVVITGDGSADNYAQQVNVQLAEQLGVASVSGVDFMAMREGKLIVERITETRKETIIVPTPSVIAVTSTIALPKICSMKEILEAGKKSSTVLTAKDIGVVPMKTVEVIAISAPEEADRKHEIFDASVDGDLDKFVTALRNKVS
jgi:electron transfer flavoprotein beta subunit